MKRHSFNLLAGLSLVICGGVVFLWISSAHSFERYYHASWTGPQQNELRATSLSALEGRLYVGWERTTFAAQFAPLFRQDTLDGFHHESIDSLGGFGLDPLDLHFQRWLFGRQAVNNANISMTNWRLVIPLWFATALSAILPIIWAVRFNQQRRQKRAGLCAKCGYDLRATPDRCPACGAIPEPAKVSN